MATTRKKAARKKATKKKAVKRKATKKKAAKKKSAKGKGFHVIDLLRSPVLASVGAFSLAEEGIERLVNEFIDRGEASEREGKKIVDDYRKRTSKTRKDLEKRIDSRITEALKGFRLPTKKDVDALNRKLNRLEKRVDQLLTKQKKSA